MVVGGGNSALEEAVSLTKYASKVTVLHVLDEFQAQPWAVEAAQSNPKVEIHTSHQVVRFDGDESLRSVLARNVATGDEIEIAAEGCFVFIGYEPNTEDYRGLLEMTERGEILSDVAMGTNIDGVYVAGDSRAKRYRQITTAVSDGTIAALSAVEYIENRRRRDRATETAPTRESAAA